MGISMIADGAGLVTDNAEFTPNTRIKAEGLSFLRGLRDDTMKVAFFDPQYRGVLDKLSYGNEGKSRGKRRAQLKQMSDDEIKLFIAELARVLVASGHLFLWMDKFHLCEGFSHWHCDTTLSVVDLIIWGKKRIGMGYRTRRSFEALVVLQKPPKRAKGIWTIKDIPDVWEESPVRNKQHPHVKPIALQRKLIEAVSEVGDRVVDPAAGSFSVMRAALLARREFWGCDIEGYRGQDGTKQ